MFAKFIESCGTVSRKKWTPGPPCPFPDMPQACQVDPVYEPRCEGDVETLHNICSLTPKLNKDGEPEVYWVQRE